MHTHASSLGIWGLGITGKSLVRSAHALGFTLGVMDNRELTPEEQQFLATYHIPFFHQKDHVTFFKNYSVIIPSAGIDLRPYKKYQEQFLSEVDFFARYHTGKTIAITGTFGKTSITHLLSQVLTHDNLTIATGGNIGTGLMDLVTIPSQYTILELSSFQLEQTKQFIPDLAIITNLYPKHLDRHETIDQYFQAKYTLIRQQKSHQQAVINADLHEQTCSQNPVSSCAYVSLTRPLFSCNHTCYYYDNQGSLYKETPAHQKKILAYNHQIPTISFPLNWLFIYAVRDLLGLPLRDLSAIPSLTLPPHRLQHYATYNQIEFYDDSKGTTPESTYIAVQTLAQRPLILLLGGISEANNRTAFIPTLAPLVKYIACFGREAELLAHSCSQAGIKHSISPTLETAFTQALAQAQPGDRVLLSPAGPSYDLFNNYTERGLLFQRLVNNLTNKTSNSLSC